MSDSHPDYALSREVATAIERLTGVTTAIAASVDRFADLANQSDRTLRGSNGGGGLVAKVDRHGFDLQNNRDAIKVVADAVEDVRDLYETLRARVDALAARPGFNAEVEKAKWWAKGHVWIGVAAVSSLAVHIIVFASKLLGVEP